MKAYLGIKHHPDNRNRETIDAVSAVLSACGYTVYCVRRDLEKWGAISLPPRELMAKTFEALRACDLAVIDLTEKGVGLGIEAGYAHALGIPVVTIAKEGSDISDTLSGISRTVHLYGSPADLHTPFSLPERLT